MIGIARQYLSELADATGIAWNRFWFAPSGSETLGLVRIGAGVLALITMGSFGSDLQWLVAGEGMLPRDFVRDHYPLSLSLFDFVPGSLLTPVWIATLVAAVLMILGIGGRWSVIATAIALLSYLNRVPLLVQPYETVLSFVLIYLCVGNCWEHLCLRFNRKEVTAAKPRVANQVSLRLIQVHLAVVHAMMAIAQLTEPEGVWWTGEGMWLLASREGMPLIDLSAWFENRKLASGLAHMVTLYLAAFPILVWGRWTRPLVLAAGLVVWLLLLIVSGRVMLCLTMLTATLVFLPKEAPAEA
ncbi:MAG: hypothetical protein RH917_10385 [Lacipirellulaceae bacterium]